MKITPYNLSKLNRRNAIEGIDLSAERNAGTYVAQSGNKASEVYQEQYFVNKHPMNLSTLNQRTAVKLATNQDVLRTTFYNTRGVTDRQLFKGPPTDFSFPMMYFGSGWYNKATKNRGPILTTTLPYGVPK
jgi:hypothetical protein